MNDPLFHNLTFRGREVPVHFSGHYPPDMKAEILRSHRLRHYLQEFAPEFTLRAIEIRDVVFFPREGGRMVGFIEMAVDALDDQGEPIVPNIVFLRGDSVGVLVLLETERELYTVLVSQPRLAMGKRTREIVAGMLDEQGSVVGVSLTELRQELGITVTRDGLEPLADGRAFMVSPGGCDERMTLFTYRAHATEAQIAELRGRLTGEVEEGERITLVIIPFSQLAEATDDLKTMLAAELVK